MSFKRSMTLKELDEYLEKEIVDFLEEEGRNVVARTYKAPRGLSEEELIDYCVGIEMENYFR